MRRLLLPPLLLLVALDLLLDEYLWHRFVRLLGWLERRLPLAKLEARIRTAPPIVALPLFLLPGLAVLPFKLMGMWLLAKGAVVAGALVFLAAKTVGTGLAAWIFTLTRETLLRLPWFRSLHDRFLALSARVHAWLEELRWWRDAKVLALRIRAWLRRVRGYFRGGDLGRRLRALRALELRRDRSGAP